MAISVLLGGRFGYNEVTMIPAGATHIRVTDNSRNYLGKIHTHTHAHLLLLPLPRDRKGPVVPSGFLTHCLFSKQQNH